MHHHMAHAERTGAEAGDIAPGLNGSSRSLGAMKNFEPVAGGIVEHDQVLDMALVGKRARAARHLVPAASIRAANGVERRRVRHLPAE